MCLRLLNISTLIMKPAHSCDVESIVWLNMTVDVDLENNQILLPPNAFMTRHWTGYWCRALNFSTETITSFLHSCWHRIKCGPKYLNKNAQKQHYYFLSSIISIFSSNKRLKIMLIFIQNEINFKAEYYC